MKKLILFSTFLLTIAQGCNHSDSNRDHQREPSQETKSQMDNEVPNKDINFTPANT